MIRVHVHKLPGYWSHPTSYYHFIVGMDLSEATELFHQLDGIKMNFVQIYTYFDPRASFSKLTLNWKLSGLDMKLIT